jgi:hypothetical protein
MRQIAWAAEKQQTPDLNHVNSLEFHLCGEAPVSPISANCYGWIGGTPSETAE